MKNDNGVTVDVVRIKLEDNTFKYKKSLFNVNRSDALSEKHKKAIFDEIHYFYNINIPDPLSFSLDRKKLEPTINPTLYKSLMDAEILIKLNTVKKGLFSDLDAKTIIMGLAIIGTILYYLFGR